MAKVTGPLMSLDARGTIADALTFSFWRGKNYVRERVIPHNPKTDAQIAIRTVMANAVAYYRASIVGETTEADWKAAAAGLGESGFNRFVRAYVAVNYDRDTQEVITPQVVPTVG